MKRTSKRFQASIWTRYLLPAILALLVIALVGVVLFVILFAVGVI